MDVVLSKVIGWIDTLFGWFGYYSERYSSLLVTGLLLFVASKIFKVKLGTSVNMGKKH